LVMKPSILLLDEPLASLDPASAHEALMVFRSLADEGTAILLVEHRVEDALDAHPDRLLYMEDGRIAYLGSIVDLPPKIDHRQVKLPAEWVVRRVREQGEVVQPHPVTPMEPNGKELVSFENVSFSYGPDLPQVLKNVNLKIHQGDLIAVLGPNGAGKSTLVKHAIGLLKPTGGRVLVNGEDTRILSVAQVARTLGYVFQSPTHMLFAPTVREELAFGPQNLGYSPEEISHNIKESIVTANLSGLEDYAPLGLSFGQQKRTTIASVLAMRSRIMVMDEPTAGQDFANYTHFMDAMCSFDENRKSLLSENFAATLFITHDVDLAVTYANRVLVVGDGKIVADGRPEEVLNDFDFLESFRVRPSSLLRMNMSMLARTGHFLPAQSLAVFLP